MRLLLLFVTFFTLIGVESQAQTEKFGKLSSKKYDFDTITKIDSTAGAFVLFSKGKTYYNGDYEQYVEKHERIWIKNESGYDNATVSINVSKGLGHNIYDLEAAYYVPTSKGDFKRKKLSKKDIFMQNGLKTNDGVLNTNFTFTIPELTPGLIFEYTYRILKSRSLFALPYWEFQRSIPVVYSEFETELPEPLSFDEEFRGSIPITNITEDSYAERRQVLEAKIYGNDIVGVNEDKVVTIHIKKYVLENIPAFVKEPYSLSRINVISSIQLHLKQWPLYSDPQIDYSSFGSLFGFFKKASNWNTYKKNSSIEQLAKQITFNSQSPTEKIDSIIHFVSKNFSYVNVRSELPYQKLDELLSSKSGNSAEIALLSILLMKEHGINANPLLINRNELPILKSQFISPIYFNDMVVVIESKGTYDFIDVVGETKKIGLYGSQALNSEALYFSDRKVGFIDVRNASKNSETALIVAELDKNGTLKGSVNFSLSGYPSSRFYNDLNKDELGKLISASWFSNHTVKIDSVESVPDESLTPKVKLNFQFEIADFAQKIDSNLIINPYLIKVLPKSPFKTLTRSSDIYLPYLISDRFIYKITLPKGFKISEAEALNPSKIVYEDGQLEYKSSFLLKENVLNGNVTFSINKRTIKQTDYTRFKLVYEEVNIAEEKTLYLLKE